MKLTQYLVILGASLTQVESVCRAKAKSDKLLGNYPSDHCYRGGVDAWVTYKDFPPCWIYEEEKSRYACYNYKEGGKCDTWPGMKDLGPSKV
ncbi:hypothetical protein K502DRAFT_325028 [Neoconidiobolus thromboides FSU 785]|nr:hypothetical protein K502DRAFT_325028 [Neoconidiobolus thromboides FSU 785]